VNNQRSEAIMRTCSLIVLFWLSLAVMIPITAMAGETEDKIFSISHIVRSRYMADGGDPKKAAEQLIDILGRTIGQPTYCDRRRVEDLTGAYRGVLMAVADLDAQRIFDSSKHLQRTIGQSKMFTRCWQTMASHAKALGDISQMAADVIVAGNTGGWL
jgi:hypothetical protein